MNCRRFALGRATHTDIRDDRVMWFFDLDYRPVDFLVKLMVVTRGEFVLAPTLVGVAEFHHFLGMAGMQTLFRSSDG